MNVQSLDRSRTRETGRAHALTPHYERLARQLAVTPAQSGPWGELVAALEVEAPRLPFERDDASGALNQVFGTLEQRLAKLARMRTAVARLFEVLEPNQRQAAERLLPLCCLRRVH